MACEARQPIAIITKNALVTRDLDILRRMAADRTVSVALSITTLDAELARVMEPRTSTPGGPAAGGSPTWPTPAFRCG